MTHIAAQMLGSTIAKGLDVALAPLTAGIGELKQAIMQNITAFNPLTALTKAFNEGMKMQEKALSMSVNLDKTSTEVKKLREQGAVQLSTMEAQKNILLNFNQGIRVNSGALASMQEQFRVTGQNEVLLRKTMADLMYATKDDYALQTKILKNARELADSRLVSEEKLMEALNGLNKETLGIASLTNQTEQLGNVAMAVQAAAAGGLQSSDINAITDILFSQKSEAIRMREILGVQQESFEDLKNLSPEEQAQKISEMSQNVIDRLGQITGNQKRSTEEFLGSMGSSYKNIIFAMNKIVSTDNTARNDFREVMVETKRRETLRAEVEKAQTLFQQWVIDNLPKIQSVIVSVGKIVTNVIEWLGKNLPFGLGDSFQSIANSLGKIYSRNLTSESSEEQIRQYAEQTGMTPEQARKFLRGVESKGISFNQDLLEKSTITDYKMTGNIKSDTVKLKSYERDLTSAEVRDRLIKSNGIGAGEKELLNVLADNKLLSSKDRKDQFDPSLRLTDKDFVAALSNVTIKEMEGYRGGNARGVLQQEALFEKLRRMQVAERNEYSKGIENKELKTLVNEIIKNLAEAGDRLKEGSKSYAASYAELRDGQSIPDNNNGAVAVK